MANDLQYTAGQRIVFMYNGETVEGSIAFDSEYQWGDKIGVFVPLENVPAEIRQPIDFEKHPDITRAYYAVSPENVVSIGGAA